MLQLNQSHAISATTLLKTEKRRCVAATQSCRHDRGCSVQLRHAARVIVAKRHDLSGMFQARCATRRSAMLPAMACEVMHRRLWKSAARHLSAMPLCGRGEPPAMTPPIGSMNAMFP
jgi:hypothetical protein